MSADGHSLKRRLVQRQRYLVLFSGSLLLTISTFVGKSANWVFYGLGLGFIAAGVILSLLPTFAWLRGGGSPRGNGRP